MFGGDLNWRLLLLGAGIGVVVLVVDALLRRYTKRLSLPGLAVGMGMYLPMAITIMIPIGAVLGMVHDKWADRQANPERAKRMGTLVATGMIVGESLWGVCFAGIVGASGQDAPLAIVPEGFAGVAIWLGVALFAGFIWALYRLARREGTAD